MDNDTLEILKKAARKDFYMNNSDVLSVLKEAVGALSEKKAIDVQAFKVDDISSLTDYVVVCSGTSSTHMKSLASFVEMKLDRNSKLTYHKEGYDSDYWILMDFGCVIINIFLPEAREFYNLEEFWKSAQPVDTDKLLSP